MRISPQTQASRPRSHRWRWLPWIALAYFLSANVVPALHALADVAERSGCTACATDETGCADGDRACAETPLAHSHPIHDASQCAVCADAHGSHVAPVEVALDAAPRGSVAALRISTARSSVPPAFDLRRGRGPPDLSLAS